MSDFFTRLAERTLGLAPVVQPDLMPLFPPLANSEVVSDALPGVEPSVERGTRPASKAAPQGGDSISSNIVTTENAARAVEVPQSSKPDWQSEPPMREPSMDESPRPVTRLMQSVVEVESSYGNPEFKTGELNPPAKFRQSPHATAVVAQTEPSEAKPAATPTIQISIGKVEIRAVTPAPALGSQRPAEHRGNPRLSLEEYLRQRNEGRR